MVSHLGAPTSSHASAQMLRMPKNNLKQITWTCNSEQNTVGGQGGTTPMRRAYRKKHMTEHQQQRSPEDARDIHNRKSHLKHYKIKTPSKVQHVKVIEK